MRWREGRAKTYLFKLLYICYFIILFIFIYLFFLGGWGLEEWDAVFLHAYHDSVLAKTCICICCFALLVTPLLYVRDINRAATLHRDTGRTEIVRRGDCTGVLLCRAWTIEADGSYVVVRAGSVY